MRESLELIQELQGRYIELPEFAKHSCIDIKKAYPLKDLNSDDELGSHKELKEL